VKEIPVVRRKDNMISKEKKINNVVNPLANDTRFHRRMDRMIDRIGNATRRINIR
jgi:hypothetical protein